MRNVMITTIGEDYVLAAQAKGLSSRRVVLTYAARNAILPQLQVFGLALGFVVSGAIIMEIVFSYPGIGLLLFNAVTSNDYPLMQADLPRDHFRRPARQPDRRHCSSSSSTPASRARDGPMTVALPISADPSAVRRRNPAAIGHWRRLPTKAKVGRRPAGVLRPGRPHRPVRRPLRPVVPKPLAQPLIARARRRTPARDDESGQDVLSQLLVGIRLTLELGFVVGVVATALSVIVGVSAGFLGGCLGRTALAHLERLPGAPGAAPCSLCCSATCTERADGRPSWS